MEYRKFIKDLDKKICKWNYAIPLGVVAYVVSNLLGGASTTIGAAVGVFNLLIIVGIITGIVELIKYFKNKNMEGEDTTIEKKEDFNFSPILGAVLLAGLLYFVFGYSNNTGTRSDNSNQSYTNNSWIIFTSPPSDFTVSLPSNPELKTFNNLPVPGTNLTRTQNQYMSKTATQAFLVGVTEFSSVIDVSDSDNLLSWGLDGMLEIMQDNRLVSSDLNSFNGNRSLDFLIEVKSLGVFIKGKLILIGQKIYQIAIEDETSNPENYDRFVNSFEVK